MFLEGPPQTDREKRQTFRMNNTALGNTSVLPLNDNFVDFYGSLMIHSFSLVARLPVNIFIIQLILSRHWITSEEYAFKEAIFAILICLYDVVRIASTFYPNKYLLNTRLFFEVIVVIGHSSLLTLTCVGQYLAVLKPLFFLKLKPLYKLASVCTTCLWTLMFCCGSLLLEAAFNIAAVGQIVVCSVTQLYCCVVILWALKQPRPGERGGQNDRTSAVKLRAAKIILFNTFRILFVYVPFTVVSCYDVFTMQQSQIVLKVCYFMGSLIELARALMFLQKSGQIAFIKWL